MPLVLSRSGARQGDINCLPNKSSRNDVVDERMYDLKEELAIKQAFCSVSVSLVLVPPVCCGAFQ